MNISSELEKLVSLRDCGDLSEAEFEKAKALLLSGDDTETRSAETRSAETRSAETRSAETRSAETVPAQKATLQDLAKKKKKCRMQLITAICATVAALFSGISVGIDPSPLKVAALILWVVVSALNWPQYAKLKTEIEREERTREA